MLSCEPMNNTNTNTPRQMLSIVATAYESEKTLEEFVRRCGRTAEAVGLSFEIILVNDGSPDSSLSIALALQKEIAEIVVVDLARNFGHHPAILAGLHESKGDIIFLVDSDLEEEPEWLLRFTTQMKESGADVVFGQQRHRKGSWFEGISGAIFYRIFNALSDTKVPENFVTARLMTRQYVDALLEYGERALFLGGTFVLAGFRQIPCEIDKGARGVSSYSLGKRLALFVNALTSFSPKPLQVIFGLGAAITAVALAGFVYVVARALLGDTLVGWASLIASIWLFGGLTLFTVGLLGVYVGKVLLETKQRPLYAVRAVHRAPEARGK